MLSVIENITRRSDKIDIQFASTFQICYRKNFKLSSSISNNVYSVDMSQLETMASHEILEILGIPSKTELSLAHGAWKWIRLKIFPNFRNCCSNPVISFYLCINRCKMYCLIIVYVIFYNRD